MTPPRLPTWPTYLARTTFTSNSRAMALFSKLLANEYLKLIIVGFSCVMCERLLRLVCPVSMRMRSGRLLRCAQRSKRYKSIILRAIARNGSNRSENYLDTGQWGEGGPSEGHPHPLPQKLPLKS